MELTRYWITFRPLPEPTFLNIGCGVTALGKADALALLSDVFGRELPPIDRIIEDVDVDTLDAGHVLPNIGVPSERGVWFPKG